MTMTTDMGQKPGCLTAFLAFFRRKKATQPKTLPYRVRDDFLSPAELSFYKVLGSVISPDYIILTKVRLADIFFVSRPNENLSYLNRISQRHIDILLCTTTTIKPVVGIELDDASHSQSTRKQRDEFVDQVFLTAGLPLVHMPVQRAYTSQEIMSRLEQYLNNDLSVSAPSQAQEGQVDSTPLCPKCGIPMVLRTASQGNYKGQQFYGCPNYPRCREVLPVTRIDL